MSRQKRAGASAGISFGTVSIIVIFSVLCLSIFAVLSLSLALSEKKLAHKTADAYTAFWQAEYAATNQINAIHALYAKTGNLAQFLEEAKELGAEVTIDGQTTTIATVTPVDANRQLEIQLTLNTQEQNKKLAVTRWQVVNTGPWTPDESIQIWNGE